MLFGTVASLLAGAGHSHLLQAITIVLGTFLLEDATTVLVAMQAESGDLSAALALMSLFAGIVLGDLGLYGLGRLSASCRWVARLVPPNRQEVIRAWLSGQVFRVVLVSRFLPGMRLPSYTTCGFLGVNLRQFVAAAIVATLCWTSLLFGVSMKVGQILIDHFGAWRWAGAAGFVLCVIIGGRLAARGMHAVRQ